MHLWLVIARVNYLYKAAAEWSNKSKSLKIRTCHTRKALALYEMHEHAVYISVTYIS